MLKSVYDIDLSGVVDEVETLPDHADDHQDGGDDEISVAALSGELADDQPPKTHDLAGAAHNADTLADLNAKVSDATLDDSAATRTPAAHKASHQDAGTDEIDATGLAGRVNYVDRGDPSEYDWEVGDLTTDGAWNDLNCSGVVPAGAMAIVLTVGVKDDAPGSHFEVRKNGNSNGYNIPIMAAPVADKNSYAQLLVHCDTDRIIEYHTNNTTFTTLHITINGWFI